MIAVTQSKFLFSTDFFSNVWKTTISISYNDSDVFFWEICLKNISKTSIWLFWNDVMSQALPYLFSIYSVQSLNNLKSIWKKRLKHNSPPIFSLKFFVVLFHQKESNEIYMVIDSFVLFFHRIFYELHNSSVILPLPFLHYDCHVFF